MAEKKAEDASADILEFAHKRPLWQQDALRRLAVQGVLTGDDVSAYLAALKVEHGLLNKDKKPELTPLTAAHLSNTTNKGATVALKALREADNVNQLKPGEKLEFGTSGLSLVYGDNGSGKSGYTRIFKKASAARSVEDILADIFTPDFEKRPPATATFDVVLGEGVKATEEPVKWAADKDSPEVLRQIRVFDRRAAVLYIEKDTDLAFVPFNLDLLDGLTGLCAKLKEILEADAKQLDSDRANIIAAIPASATARLTAEKVGAETKAADLDTTCAWDANSETRMNELRELMETSDGVIKTLRLKKGRLDVLAGQLELLEIELADDKATALSEERALASDLRRAAEASGKASFSKDPKLLAGVSSPAWQALWEAARRYSTEAAYTGKPFPVTQTDGKPGQCVLCQQDLGPEARGRLEAFEAFVKGDVEKKAKTAEDALAKARARIQGLNISASATVDELAVDDEALAGRIKTFLIEAGKRRDALAHAATTGDFGAVPNLAAPVRPALSKVIEATQGKLSAAELSMTEEQKAKNTAEIALLASRKSHAEHRPSLEKLIANRLFKRQLEECESDLATNAISRAKKDLNEKYVTSRFKGILTEELTSLGVRRKVTLSQKAASVKPAFSDSTFTRLEKILSDGEHRAVALACFLAETRVLGTANPLVIDDPVSSLDHIRREQVAKRLVEEAKTRQVVIFTHDMVFWGEVCFLAAEEKVPVVTRDLRRDGVVCGKVGDGQVPWPIMPVKNRLQYIEAEKLPAIRKLHEADSPEYREASRFVGELLRETWERLIEELLFNETVVRYRRSIETTRLMRVVVEDQDWEAIHRGMTRTSKWAHDESRGTGGAPPVPEDLKVEVDTIRKLADKLKTSGEEHNKRRKTLVK